MGKKRRSPELIKHDAFMDRFIGQVITEELIRKCQTPAGGFTNKFFRMIGEPTKCQSGWRHRAIGRIFQYHSKEQIAIHSRPNAVRTLNESIYIPKPACFAEVGATGIDSRAD